MNCVTYQCIKVSHIHLHIYTYQYIFLHMYIHICKYLISVPVSLERLLEITGVWSTHNYTHAHLVWNTCMRTCMHVSCTPARIHTHMHTHRYRNVCIYRQSHMRWYFWMLFQSSKLKARTSLFTETWQKRRSSFEIWNSIRTCHLKWDRLYLISQVCCCLNMNKSRNWTNVSPLRLSS